MRTSPRPGRTHRVVARVLPAIARVIGRIAEQHGLRERVVAVMREREDYAGRALGERDGAALSGEHDGRSLTALAAHLDLAPLDPHAKACAQRLERGLLRGKPRGEVLDGIAMTLAIRDLAIGED